MTERASLYPDGYPMAECSDHPGEIEYPDSGCAKCNAETATKKPSLQSDAPEPQAGSGAPCNIFLDLSGLVSFDHLESAASPSDGSVPPCPLTVFIDGGDVVLLARTERLGVLLAPQTARALGLSLIAASEEASC